MRVVLLHNTSAGSEDHTDEDLVLILREAGHEVVKIAADVDALAMILEAHPCDVVAVAGGDGTVGHAACVLAQRQVPIAVLPLGTANNTARTLGLCGELRELVSRWSTSTLRSIDLVSARVGEARVKFSEAVGWGIFPDVIARAKAMSDPRQARHTLDNDRHIFQSVLATAKPRHYDIEADGVDCSGEYLLVEVVNIPFIGPQLELSPTSDPGDGKLELVLAGERDRAALLDMARSGAFEPTKMLPARSVKRVVVRVGDGGHHRDGSLFAYQPGAREIVITPEPAAVRYLVPS